MKNITKFLTGGLLTASLLFANPQNSQAQLRENQTPFEMVKVMYPVNGDNITYVSAYQDSWDDGPLCRIHYKKDKSVETWTHKNDSIARYQTIKISEDGKLTNKIYSQKHNLDNGEWPGGWNLQKEYSGEKDNFPLHVQDRIKKIMNMNKTCNHDWRYFLNKNISKSSGYDKEDVDSYSIYYYFWDEDNFPEEKRVYAYGPEEYDYHYLAKLEYEDTDEDNIYDKITFEYTKEKKSLNRFVYEIDYDSAKFDYSFYYLDIKRTHTKNIPLKNIEKGLGKKLKEILTNGKIDCSSNELIPFLYDEYYRWNEEE